MFQINDNLVITIEIQKNKFGGLICQTTKIQKWWPFSGWPPSSSTICLSRVLRYILNMPLSHSNQSPKHDIWDLYFSNRQQPKDLQLKIDLARMGHQAATGFFSFQWSVHLNQLSLCFMQKFYSLRHRHGDRTLLSKVSVAAVQPKTLGLSRR